MNKSNLHTSITINDNNANIGNDSEINLDGYDDFDADKWLKVFDTNCDADCGDQNDNYQQQFIQTYLSIKQNIERGCNSSNSNNQVFSPLGKNSNYFLII